MSRDAANYRLAFRILADFSAAIAAPAVLAAILGKYLDTRYSTSPRFLITLFVLAFLATAYLVVKKAKRYRDEYEAINKKIV